MRYRCVGVQKFLQIMNLVSSHFYLINLHFEYIDVNLVRTLKRHIEKCSVN